MTPNSRTCRSCGSPLHHSVLDLGKTPLANSLQTLAQLSQPEVHYPLRTFFCAECFLVQADDFAAPEDIFSDYVYFSSFSTTWIEHCRRHAETMIGRLNLGSDSFVVEVASNDGYMLRNFVAAGVPSLGIEPAANVAEVARAAGVPTDVAFFGAATAERIVASHGQADFACANNVLAHVPDLNDFVAGFAVLMKRTGVLTIEFPHLANLIRFNQFDTIYHEHFSYLSLIAVRNALARHGMVVFDVEEVPTHGGSLRLYVGHGNGPHAITPAVEAMAERERQAGLADAATYAGFAERALAIKLNLLQFLIGARRDGRTVAAYGAAAKGNTLLNYCGVGADLITAVADRNPNKQGKYLPGSGIPVVDPSRIAEIKPDFLLILPWNLKDEIMAEMSEIRSWGGRFVTPIPVIEII